MMRHILLADDQPLDLEIYARYLTKMDKSIEVTTARSAEELIDQARRGQWTAILSDNNMHDGHGNSGIYAANTVRQFDRATPFILHTDFLHDQIVALAQAAGVTKIAQKGDRESTKALIAPYCNGFHMDRTIGLYVPGTQIATTAKAVTPDPAKPAASAKRMLLADDDEGMRYSCSRYAKMAYPSVQVRAVSNAQELIDAAREGPWTLIVTDNNMKDGHRDSGVFATREIRAFDPMVPIVIQTGELEQRLRDAAAAAGANHIIEKMGSRPDYKDILRMYLG